MIFTATHMSSPRIGHLESCLHLPFRLIPTSVRKTVRLLHLLKSALRFSTSVELPTKNARTETGRTPPYVGPGRTRPVMPFARRSASLWNSRGAHSTTVLIPLAFTYDASSINRAEDGKRVDINLFNAAPLPLLFVIDGTMRTVVSSDSGS